MPNRLPPTCWKPPTARPISRSRACISPAPSALWDAEPAEPWKCLRDAAVQRFRGPRPMLWALAKATPNEPSGHYGITPRPACAASVGAVAEQRRCPQCSLCDLRAADRNEEAAACYINALEIAALPAKQAVIHANLGNTLMALDQSSDAEGHFQGHGPQPRTMPPARPWQSRPAADRRGTCRRKPFRCTAVSSQSILPDDNDALTNLGVALLAHRRCGRRRGLLPPRHRPDAADNAEAHYNLAWLLLLAPVPLGGRAGTITNGAGGSRISARASAVSAMWCGTAAPSTARSWSTPSKGWAIPFNSRGFSPPPKRAAAVCSLNARGPSHGYSAPWLRISPTRSSR